MLELAHCVEIPGRGRGLVASRDIKAGETIVREPPLIACMVEEGKKAYCAACFRKVSKGARRCTGCGEVSFCSAGCAATACCKGGSHDPSICLGLERLGEVTSEETRDLLRYLLQAYALKASNPEAFSELLTLVGSVDGVSSTDGILDDLHARCVEAVGGLVCSSRDETAALVHKEQQNSYGIMAPLGQDGERYIRGSCMYGASSMVNHSCLPNCARFDYTDVPGPDNLDVYLRAMIDISKGDEVLACYFPLGVDIAQRRERLQQDYGFYCDCKRCAVEETWSDDDASDAEDESEEEGKAVGGISAEKPKPPAAAKGKAPMLADEAAETGSDSGGEEISAVEMTETFQSLFMMKHMCAREVCGGTLAPGAVEGAMECNMCGQFRPNTEFYALLMDDADDARAIGL